MASGSRPLRRAPKPLLFQMSPGQLRKAGSRTPRGTGWMSPREAGPYKSRLYRRSYHMKNKKPMDSPSWVQHPSSNCCKLSPAILERVKALPARGNCPPMTVPRMTYPVGRPCFFRNLNRKSLTSLDGEVVSTTKSSVSFAPRTTQPFPKNLVVAFSKSGSLANFR